MKTITASYNFPPEFLWGIDPGRSLSDDPGSTAFLFQMKEKSIDALLLMIPWDRCEPLKGHYDDAYIESLRSFLGRMKTRGIEPLVIPDIRQVPAWQNLDHPGKKDEEGSGIYAFYRYLVDALIPYTKFFGILCPAPTLFRRKSVNRTLEHFSELSAYIHSVSEQAKTGLILPDEFGSSKTGGWILKSEYEFLKSTEADFLGLRADGDFFPKLNALFERERKPVMIFSDGLRNIPDQDKADSLADMLFNCWNFYQEGWPVLGYFSETDITASGVEVILYENSCKNNAFRISTDMPDISEKWIRFLKD